MLLHFVVQRQDAAGEAAVRSADHPVAVIFGHSLADVPADDSVVERLRAIGVWGHQFVPDEVAARTLGRLLRGRRSLSNVSHGSISFSEL